jgi:hypothetical protein
VSEAGFVEPRIDSHERDTRPWYGSDARWSLSDGTRMSEHRATATRCSRTNSVAEFDL